MSINRSTRRQRLCSAALAAALALGSCGTDGTMQRGLDVAQGVDPADWPAWGRTGAAQQYSPLDQIDGTTIGRLALAWHYDLEPGFTVSEPLKVGDKLFVTTGHSFVRAFEAATGKLLWEYDGKTRERATSAFHISWGNKGLAYDKGRIFLATTDGLVIALDAESGREVWRTRDFAEGEMRNIGAAPRVFAGKVIVGHGGADVTPLRGYVSAYDAATGKLAWRFYTVPGDPAKPAESVAERVMRPTWKGDWFGKGGGGTAWNAFSYDPELNLIYLGVGNGFPYAQTLRSPGGGDNLFLASIVAVDASTGAYRWHYQVCPAEQWDCTATMDMTLADIEIAGRPRKVLMQAPKNGFFYVLDRATGELLSAEKIAKVTWASRIDMTTGRPVENPGIRYENAKGLFELWPGPQGAHSWLPQAYNPATKLVYIPVIEQGALIGPADPRGAGLRFNNGATLIPEVDLPGNRRSFLKAWDPAAQKAAWQVELPGSWPAGVLTTAGGLVFQGRMDGAFVAYDAKTGRQVWSFQAQAPIVAPPIAWSVGGKQYVTVLTGSGGTGGGLLSIGNAKFRTDYRLPRHILTFALGRTDKLPAFTPPPLATPSDPGFRPDVAAITAGGMAFGMNGCLACHGWNAIGGGAAPDLRYSSVIVDADAFRAVVQGGALKPNGMPGYPQIATADIEKIRFYLRARAAQTAVEGPLSGSTTPVPMPAPARVPVPAAPR